MDLKCDLSKIGEQKYVVDGLDFSVEVVDSVQDYLDLMKEIFDFDALRAFFKSGVKITVNSLNGGISNQTNVFLKLALQVK